jgi:hypothetical protein
LAGGDVKKRLKTETTIETHEVWVIKRPCRILLAWCPTCCEQVKMVRPEEAAALTEVNLRTIFRWADTARVHFTETPDGLLLVCLDSLTPYIEEQITSTKTLP